MMRDPREMSPVEVATAQARAAWRAHIERQAAKVSPIERRETRLIMGVPHQKDPLTGNWRPV